MGAAGGFADDLRLARDERGYIRTDFATAETSVPDIYAIGEVAHRMHPCVVTSMADGVVAARPSSGAGSAPGNERTALSGLAAWLIIIILK